MGAPQVSTTAYNTAVPMTFCQTRQGKLVGVNGLEQGFIWDGKNTSFQFLGIDRPVLAPTIAHAGGGTTGAGAVDDVYYFAYRYLAYDGTPSSLSLVTSFTATGTLGFAWSALSNYPLGDARIQWKELYRSTAGLTTGLYRIARVSAATTSYTDDGISDAECEADPLLSDLSYKFATSSNQSGKVRIAFASANPLWVGAVVRIYDHNLPGYNSSGAGPYAGREHTVTNISGLNADLDTDYSGVDGTTGYVQLQNHFLAFQDSITAKPIGRRFEPPPKHKKVAVWFQDRMWMGADAIYTTGTVSGSIGDSNVTGSGTAWTAGMVGRFIYINGETIGYKINRIVSATSLYFTGDLAANRSAVTYAIKPDPEEEDLWYFSEPDEPESMPPTNVVAVQRRTDDADRWTAAAPVGASLWLFAERSTYRLTFARQPDIDANPSLLAVRGCLNQRCWTAAEGVVFVMDAAGIWRFTVVGDPSIDETVSLPIQNLFTERLVDLSKAQYFFAENDPTEGVVRFWITLTSDTNTYPRRALCYNYRLGAWWMELRLKGIGGSVLLPVGTSLRRITGGEDDRVWKEATGLWDGTAKPSGTLRGTVSSSTSTSLTISANSPSDANGAVVAVISGTGKRQWRVITAGQGTTSLTTTPAWTTNPASGDLYIIGGVEWTSKSGMWRLPTDGDHGAREVAILYEPTANPTLTDARFYYNRETSARAMQGPPTGDPVVQMLPGDDDIQITMDSAASQHGTSPGYARISLGGHGEHWGNPDRWVALELQGYQGETAVQIYGMELYGLHG